MAAATNQVHVEVAEALTEGTVHVTSWPQLEAADYEPVRAPGERSAYRAMLTSGGPNLFLRAVKDGESEIVMKLVEYGADVKTAMDGYQNSALHYASFHGHHSIMKMLLQHGASPNSQNHVRNTPLHLAVENVQHESVVVLLMSGADLAAENMLHQAPLQLARAMGEQRAEMQELLQKYEAVGATS
jgi:ankyrin repeat protein